VTAPYPARLTKLHAFGVAGQATRFEARQQRGHSTAKSSPSGDRLRGGGGQMPGRNPFLSVSGPGGAAGLTLLSLLAVLAASIRLWNELSGSCRTRAALRRPSAYVPPLELPG
jgi:hypothetical protein